jgi:hypothetical protein
MDMLRTELNLDRTGPINGQNVTQLATLDIDGSCLYTKLVFIRHKVTHHEVPHVCCDALDNAVDKVHIVEGDGGSDRLVWKLCRLCRLC